MLAFYVINRVRHNSFFIANDKLCKVKTNIFESLVRHSFLPFEGQNSRYKRILIYSYALSIIGESTFKRSNL